MKKTKDLDLRDLFAQNTFGEQFLIYLGNRIGNPHAVWDNMDNESLQQEFIAKCQFIQHYARAKLGVSSITMELAAITVNNVKARSFNVDICEKIFDGFMHFIAVNEKNPAVLKSLMDTWLLQGRSLGETIIIDEVEFTPLNFALAKNNLHAFASLAQHGVDVTQLDLRGFSELHKLVDQIEKGTSDITMLQTWVGKGLRTDMVADERAGGVAGKTAVEVAQGKGLVEITRMLGGNVELAEDNLNILHETQKELILAAYYQKTSDLQKGILKTDPNKFLLHYLVENSAEVPIAVFQKFIADKTLGIKTNIVGTTRNTVLELLVIQGVAPTDAGAKANQFALVLANCGVGTTIADNGSTILSYAVRHNNHNLFDLIVHFPIVAKPANVIKVGESCNVIDGPLINALLHGRVDMVQKLVGAGYNKCTVLLPSAVEKTWGIIQSIRAFGGDHKATLVKLVSDHVDMNSEAVVQEMVNAIIKGEADFVKALVDNGTDINYNDGELLALFTTHKMLPAMKLAIENGAKVTEKVKIIAAGNGLGSSIEELVLEQSKMKLAQKPISKMKLLLTKILDHASDEEIALSFPGEQEKFVQLAKNLRENTTAFKILCRANKLAIFPVELIVEREEGKQEEDPSSSSIELAGDESLS